MSDFISTAASRETDVQIMQAIRAVAGSESAAIRVLESPTESEVLAIWERVTNNGQMHSSEFCWGAAGSSWAAEFGLEG